MRHTAYLVIGGAASLFLTCPRLSAAEHDPLQRFLAKQEAFQDRKYRLLETVWSLKASLPLAYEDDELKSRVKELEEIEKTVEQLKPNRDSVLESYEAILAFKAQAAALARKRPRKAAKPLTPPGKPPVEDFDGWKNRFARTMQEMNRRLDALGAPVQTPAQPPPSPDLPEDFRKWKEQFQKGLQGIDQRLEKVGAKP